VPPDQTDGAWALRLAVTGGPQQFNLTAAAAPENENMAGHGIVFQRRLYFRSQAVEAISHIGDTGNQPNFGPESNGSIASVPVSAESGAFR